MNRNLALLQFILKCSKIIFRLLLELMEEEEETLFNLSGRIRSRSATLAFSMELSALIFAYGDVLETVNVILIRSLDRFRFNVFITEGI